MVATLEPEQLSVAKKPEKKEKPYRFQVHIVDVDLVAAINEFIDSQRFPLKQKDFVETALKNFLASEGFWPRKSGSQR